MITAITHTTVTEREGKAEEDRLIYTIANFEGYWAISFNEFECEENEYMLPNTVAVH